MTEKVAKKEGLDTNLVWEATPWVILSAVVGARLYHVLDFWDVYSQNPLDAFAIWKGGLGIFGALIFGLSGLVIFLRTKKQNLLKWLNIISVPVPLAQAIGRAGNYFNKELYGIGPIPFFALEATLDFILFLILYFWFIRYQRNTLGIYLVGYGFIRFATEFFRNDSWHVETTNVAQVISIVFILSGILVIKRAGGPTKEP
jgi:phosphatidylglycerol:prolipoprotein diacylglycerol transferase